MEKCWKERKKTDKPYVAVLLYTVQPVIHVPDVCTKFQNPRSISS